ncbi:MAG: class E sortase [Candidatus Levybacteria bacterium]|nr:class E sortase [Candidatus Levybacteria bacterium]
MTRKEAIKFLIIRSIGNFLLLFAIYGVIATFGPAIYFEINYKIIQTRGIRYEVVEDITSPLGKLLAEKKGQTQPGGFGNVLTGSTKQILIPYDTNFSLLIPKIGANARVIPNVDSTNEEAFLPVLKEGVAHAAGTVFPGGEGNTYLFAHSTDNFWDVGRYNAIFYLLKDLSVGDDIVVFYQGTRYNYKVSETRIVDAEDVSFITGAQGGEEQLILQTCWPPGTTWKRLLVFAAPK